MTPDSAPNGFYRHTLFRRGKSAKSPYAVGSAGRCESGESRLPTYTLSPALKSVVSTLARFSCFDPRKPLFPLLFRYEFELVFRLTYCCARLFRFTTKLIHLLPGFFSFFIRCRLHNSEGEVILIDFKG